LDSKRSDLPRRRTNIAVAAGLLLLAAGVSGADDIYVDWRNDTGMENGSQGNPFNTIQEGIDAGVSGDRVLVADGTYFETIFMDDGVSVIGAGADRTIIDGTGLQNSVVTFDRVRLNPVLSGFTLTGGAGDRLGDLGEDPIFGGGGIQIVDSEATIEFNIITGNVVDQGIAFGGGIYALIQNTMEGGPTIRQNYIHGNAALSVTLPQTGRGGGLYIETKLGVVAVSGNRIESNEAWRGGGMHVENTAGSTVEVSRNRIRANSAGEGGGVSIRDVDASSTTAVNNVFRENEATSGHGGAVLAEALGGAVFSVSNNTFVDNFATLGNGGALFLDDSQSGVPDNLAANNIFVGNQATGGGAVDHTAFGGTIRNNDFFGNTGGDLFDGGGSGATLIGNTFVDPQFSNATIGDYRLDPASALVDVADEPSAPADDREAFPRPFDGDGDMAAVSDVGAFEYPSGEVDELVFVDKVSLSWNMPPMQGYNLYRGRFARLLALGEYTQDPLAEPLAAQFCGLTPADVPFVDATEPTGVQILFYLATKTDGADWESELGPTPHGLPRRNLNACP
jgi:hypothetical protein